MATFGTAIRRGLPRQPGGEPWPPGGVAVAEPPVLERTQRDETPVSQVGERTERDETPLAAAAAAVVAEPAQRAEPAEVPGRAALALRRGLPRTAGGEPWPPAGTAPAGADPDRRPSATAVASLAASQVGGPSELVLSNEPQQSIETTAQVVNEGSGIRDAGPKEPTRVAAGGVALRRGLPRKPGGEPWPPADATLDRRPSEHAVTAPAAAVVASQVSARSEDVLSNVPQQSLETTAEVVNEGNGIGDAAPAASAGLTGTALRRGLPRTAGGEPWPPRGVVPPRRVEAVAASAAAATSRAAAETPAAPAAAETRAAASVAVPVDLSVPLPFTRTVWPGKNAFTHPQPSPEPQRYGPFTRLQWAGAVIVGGAGLLIAAGMAVLFVRWMLSLPFMVDFLTMYPGEYPLPEGAPVGIPPWLGWQHFFNVFLMVLIIRSGLQVRTEKRPTAFWSRRSSKRKISLNLWFHQSLDILWIVNGVIYIVLLFATAQWMKIVPTSWAVFPNAVSAGLQYVSLDWPTENGWVNYNSLQQLAYFATVFLAAPLAIATGVRMSGVWPKNAKALNSAYRVEWARAVHFPVMLYFVAFIIVHVALVLATGALRNLNHMYASQDAVNWTGFWIFIASLVVIAAAWIAARPLVLAPIARLFGKVSAR